MSGRHRKPTKTAVRLARAGALTVMATAPLALTGSAMASPLAPTDRDSNGWADHHSSSRADDSDWDDDDDDWGDDDDSPSFGHADYRHASDDDSPSWRSDSDNSDSDSDSDNSSDSDSASSSDDDSPHWRYAEPHSSRSSDSSRASDAIESEPSRAHRQPSARALPSGRHSEPVTPQAHDAKWDKLAQCESTQNWDANTGNGYKGGLQFDDRTWRNYGGTEYAPTADRASRDEQIAVAKKVQGEQGWHAWPGCSHKLGYA
jgi:hypothetical protein